MLDDVPDVSNKHLASASSLGADVRLDLDDLVDDIPTPGPSHGMRPSPAPSSRVVTTPIRAARPRQLTPAPTRTSQIIPAQAPPVQAPPVQSPREPRAPTAPPVRNAQDSIATPLIGVGVGVHSTTRAPRVRTVTIPPLTAPASAANARTVPSLPPPPPSGTSPSEDGDELPTPVHGVPVAARGAATAAPPRRGSMAAPRGVPITSAATPRSDTERNPTLPGGDWSPRPDTSTTERTPAFSPDDFLQPSDTVPSMPALHSSEPIVRFRAPTIPPVEATPPPSRHTSRLLTPATELFAEPEPESQPAARTPATSAHSLQRPASLVGATETAPHRRATLRRILVLVLALLLAGAAAIAASRYVTQARDITSDDRSPVPVPHPTIGTLKLSVVPEDSAITIAGRPIHAGSPWKIDLPPGVHQIEIHHDGYKGWLTSIDLVAGESEVLRVVLEPLDSAVITDATLIVASTPPALETVLDGATLTVRTPIKMPLAPGPHTVVLRMNGVDVWKQPLDARASAIYEFHPTINPGNPGNPGSPGNPANPDIAGAPHPDASPTLDAALPEPGPSTAPEPGRPPPDRAPDSAAPTDGSVAPTPPDQATPTPAPPAPAPPAVRPASVSPKAVVKLSGAIPRVGRPNSADLPAVISAKLCIDEAGQVMTSDVLTPMQPPAAAEILDVLRGWRYAPYKANGVARAACFVVTFPSK